MKPTNFSYHLTGYLAKYLPGRAGISRNIIQSYRDTFSLLLRFCLEIKEVLVEKIVIDTLTKDIIDEFLTWIEMERQCSISTRNQRLAAIHSFYKYLQMEAPEHIYRCQQILAIPVKRTSTRSIEFLTLDGIKAILDIPDTTTMAGRRNHVLLSLMYDTGARVQEIADLVVSDVRLSNPATVKLTGKGNKSRIVPLMTPTVKLLEQYLSENDMKKASHGQNPLFQNRSRGKLTRAGITYILKRCVDEARVQHPELIPNSISPHSFRHSKAMHLLQSGVNLVYLLGHVSIKTTEVYARADSEMKRRALEDAYQGVTSSEMPIWQQNNDLLKWLKELGK
ncbi:site-specific integrase [Aneurinibacillus sp. Ricciae_BoGa-3]|uniref:site-specific integrase n=1 Tax=Aneurinibacillus sp. Ricciae_BoGa-3 TaxID=3022697 RepID=UPI0023419ED6|nr:site-specific integrase [Aneurinibacillus sp. Ricciae_BoGa-3]WCK52498.1 site-specific integrase [Aneurinibacillus sp. Ricciae_BoGa-3]